MDFGLYDENLAAGAVTSTAQQTPPVIEEESFFDAAMGPATSGGAASATQQTSSSSFEELLLPVRIFNAQSTIDAATASAIPGSYDSDDNNMAGSSASVPLSTRDDAPAHPVVFYQQYSAPFMGTADSTTGLQTQLVGESQQPAAFVNLQQLEISSSADTSMPAVESAAADQAAPNGDQQPAFAGAAGTTANPPAAQEIAAAAPLPMQHVQPIPWAPFAPVQALFAVPASVAAPAPAAAPVPAAIQQQPVAVPVLSAFVAQPVAQPVPAQAAQQQPAVPRNREGQTTGWVQAKKHHRRCEGKQQCQEGCALARYFPLTHNKWNARMFEVQPIDGISFCINGLQLDHYLNDPDYKIVGEVDSANGVVSKRKVQSLKRDPQEQAAA